MKKILPTSLIALVLIIAFISALPRLIDMFVFFILAGAVPGTSHTIGPNWMLAVMLLLFVLFSAHLITQSFVKRPHVHSRKKSSFSENLPTRRFHQI